VRRYYEVAHGRIEQDYWCYQLRAGAALSAGANDRKPEFRAIVNWQQEDGDFVGQLRALDDLEVATRYVPAAADHRTCLEVKFLVVSGTRSSRIPQLVKPGHHVGEGDAGSRPLQVARKRNPGLLGTNAAASAVRIESHAWVAGDDLFHAREPERLGASVPTTTRNLI
jgi:hypothetical protein